MSNIITNDSNEKIISSKFCATMKNIDFYDLWMWHNRKMHSSRQCLARSISLALLSSDRNTCSYSYINDLKRVSWDFIFVAIGISWLHVYIYPYLFNSALRKCLFISILFIGKEETQIEKKISILIVSFGTAIERILKNEYVKRAHEHWKNDWICFFFTRVYYCAVEQFVYDAWKARYFHQHTLQSTINIIYMNVSVWVCVYLSMKSRISIWIEIENVCIVVVYNDDRAAYV